MKDPNRLDSRKSMYHPPPRPEVKHRCLRCRSGPELIKVLDNLATDGHTIAIHLTSFDGLYNAVYVRPNPRVPWRDPVKAR